MRSALLLTAALSTACATTQNAQTGAGPEASRAAHGISFIEDDLPRALALARAQHKPLFVDAWAPW
ncbi:MAG: hypothetical protein IRZ16_14520 [Myxococcaceae bacterium]|nr:hypothetical protein [Myxococcaceae bacterium]